MKYKLHKLKNNNNKNRCTESVHGVIAEPNIVNGTHNGGSQKNIIQKKNIYIKKSKE